MNKLIYCGFGEDALEHEARALLDRGTHGWELAFAPQAGWSNLALGAHWN